LELAHVLFIDIVTLNQIVRGTHQFHKAETAGRLIKIRTGDGMALVFYNV